MPSGKLVRDKSGKVVGNVPDRAVARNKGQTSTRGPKGPGLRQKAIDATSKKIGGLSKAFGEAHHLTKGIVPATRGGKAMAQVSREYGRGPKRKDKSPWEKK